MNTSFYCYALLDPRKPGKFSYEILGITVTFHFEPFYIGKGKGNRLLQHVKPSYVNRERGPKRNKIKALLDAGESVIAEKFSENMAESDSFAMEIAAIQIVGRMDIQTGPLTNLNDGGVGQSGNQATPETKAKMSLSRKGKPGVIPGAESRAKMSAAKKGKPLSEETKAKMSEVRKGRPGRKLSDEEKLRISQRQIGKIASDETRQKMSATRIGKECHNEESKRRLSEIQKSAPRYPCEHCGKFLTKNLLALPTHRTAFCLTEVYKKREAYRIRVAESKSLS